LTRTLGTTSSTRDQTDESTITRTDWTRRFTAIINRVVRALAKHWLLIANTVVSLYAGLPVLAPVLMATGHTSAARLTYRLLRPLCHQLPERSFFLFGPQASYTLGELERLTGPNVPLDYIGSPALGYKIAVCQRDFAVFLAALVAGLAFALLRRRLRPLSIKAFVLFCIPMALDGFGQLIALWESTWWSRVLSGALFGVACVWLAYPYIESGMNDVLRVAEQGIGEKTKP
jgi:uncharacterized membrane protein